MEARLKNSLAYLKRKQEFSQLHRRCLLMGMHGYDNWHVDYWALRESESIETVSAITTMHVVTQYSMCASRCTTKLGQEYTERRKILDVNRTLTPEEDQPTRAEPLLPMTSSDLHYTTEL